MLRRLDLAARGVDGALVHFNAPSWAVRAVMSSTTLPRLSEDRLNLAQPHSPSLPTHCSGKSGMRPPRLPPGAVRSSHLYKRPLGVCLYSLSSRSDRACRPPIPGSRRRPNVKQQRIDDPSAPASRGVVAGLSLPADGITHLLGAENGVAQAGEGTRQPYRRSAGTATRSASAPGVARAAARPS